MPTIIGGSEGREGSIRIRSRNGTPIIEETYTYIVEADGKYQQRLEILATPGLPTVNVSASAGGLAICVAKDATRRSANSLIWDVTAEFSSEVDEENDSSDPSGTAPEAWIPVYETLHERIQESVVRDKSNQPIANSAKTPYATGLTLTRFIPIWKFYQFEPSTVTDETIIARSEVVNSVTFKGRPAKSLLCIVNSSVIGFYYGRRRRLTYYTLKYNSKLWTHKRFDVGPYQLSGEPCKNLRGEPIEGALDGSGTQLAYGATPAINSFDIYDEMPFQSFLRI